MMFTRVLVFADVYGSRCVSFPTTRPDQSCLTLSLTSSRGTRMPDLIIEVRPIPSLLITFDSIIPFVVVVNDVESEIDTC